MLQQSVAMLLSLTATTTLLPLVCFIGAVTCSEGGGSNKLSQSAVLPKLTQETAGITLWEVIDLTIFKWLYSTTDDVTNLTICAQKALLEENETAISKPTLLYLLEGSREKNIEGVFLEGNPSCAVFTENETVPLAVNKTSYQLSLIVAKNDSEMLYKSGSITFGMPVQTSTLTCRETTYTRVAGLTSDITLDFVGLCLNDDQQSGTRSVCYLEGEFSSSYLCFNTTARPEFQVCLQGSNLTVADQAHGGHTIRHLAYDSDSDTAGGHLSLDFGKNQPTDGMEAIIWKEGNAFATSCPKTNCYIPDFTPGLVQYDVCAVLLIGGLANKTSTDTIKDLNLIQLPGDPQESGAVLEFVFANALPEMVYRATVLSSQPKGDTKILTSVEVDCKFVREKHGCFGFLVIKDLNGMVYLAVSRASNDTNKVVSTYDSGMSTTTEAAQMLYLTQQHHGSEQTQSSP